MASHLDFGLDYRGGRFAHKSGSEPRRDRHDAPLSCISEIGESGFDIWNSDKLAPLLRNPDLLQVGLSSENSQTRRSLAGRPFLERRHGSPFDRPLQIPDVPGSALDRVILPARFARHPLIDKLLDAALFELQR